VVTGSRRLGRTAPACAWAAALLALGGCVTVSGSRVGSGGAYRTAASGSDATRGQALARPFLPLPAVSPAAVPDSYDPTANSAAAIAAALAASRADGRPVLLDFGSSWCDDCRALSALVETPGVQLVLSRNYHLVTVDVGHYDTNMQLAAGYVRLTDSGIPALALLAPDGTPRHASNDGQFADARALTADQLADTLVDWLYPPYGGAG